MKINVKYIPCLLDESTWKKWESYNETPLSILMSMFQKFPETRDGPPGICVRVNGEKIHPLFWKKPLNDGDEVSIIQEVGYETIIAALFYGGVAEAMVGAWGGTLATVLTVGTYVASIAYTIYSYATAPKAPSTGAGLNSSPTYGWDGSFMQVRQGVPVPVVYGEHRIPGHIIGDKWS